MGIPLFLNEQYLSYHIEKSMEWIPEKAPHTIIIGATGSGKTYATKLVLGRISLHIPDSQIYICDYKGDDDFRFLIDSSRFFRYQECSTGLDIFFKRFQDRQLGVDTTRNMILLYFDEWASYLNNIIDKKGAEEEKRKLATLLMLGRSFRTHVLIAQQRADAVYFQSARDNFNQVIGLGNLSQESKDMFFHEFRDFMKPDRRQGTGYMLTNGTDFTPIQVPTISDKEKLHKYIKMGVTR